MNRAGNSGRGGRGLPGRPCRAVVRALADWAVRPARDATRHPHVSTCPSCTRRVEAARRAASWLASAPAVSMPRSASGEAVPLEAVLDRFLAEREETMSRLLGEGLPPVRAETPATGQQAARPAAEAAGPAALEALGQEEARRMGTLLRKALPAAAAPGWLWGRVRTNLGSVRRRARARVLARRAAAASLLAASLVAAFLLLPRLAMEEAGVGVQTVRLRAVIVDVEAPLDPSLLPGAILEEAAQPMRGGG